MHRSQQPRVLGPVLPRAVHMPRNVTLPKILRVQMAGTNERTVIDPLGRDALEAMLEAALLIADEPLPIRKLVQILAVPDVASVRRLLAKLQQHYDEDRSAFELEELAGGFQLMTRPEYHRWLATSRHGQADPKLTAPSRETLAIVAYRQPIMRADIESIRGVHCGETLRLLMEKGLVKITGRDDSLGRPVLYGTTKKFLQVFGLKSLRDLPNIEKTPGSSPQAT